ncbi:TVP38/TMEM64 family protein [bacterium]|jgi:uncharacterized membrane protein YdjX (TVP38/TMEM64 family)|nr:TVP38/TMEM64 family protein [bacterium]
MPQNNSLPTRRKKLVVAALLCILFAFTWYSVNEHVQFEALANQEHWLRGLLESNPVTVSACVFLIYVAATGLSIPGAWIFSLFIGWYLGFTRGLLMVSFASTAGATLAFLSSRYLLREVVTKRFGDRLDSINQRLQQDGVFYLFTLRLIPAIPFFMINLLMGLTPLSVRKFWLVSQIGMLPGTIVYVYFGSNLPNLKVLGEPNQLSIVTPELLLGFIGIGGLPWIAKLIIRSLKKPSHTIQD